MTAPLAITLILFAAGLSHLVVSAIAGFAHRIERQAHDDRRDA